MIDKEIIECKNGQCSFDITGKQFFLQKWYHCITCFPSDQEKGCCESCKLICHKDHHIEDRGMQYCFCDCGSGDCPINCMCKANKKIDLNGQFESENITMDNQREEQANKISIEAQPINDNKNACKITKNESSLFLRSLKNPNQIDKSKGKDKTKRKPFHLYV